MQHITPHHAPQQAPRARSHGHRAAGRRTFSTARPALAHGLGAARKQALSAQQDRPAFFRGDHSRGTFGLPRGQGVAPEDAVLDWAMQASLQERRLINRWEHGAALARLPLETDADVSPDDGVVIAKNAAFPHYAKLQDPENHENHLETQGFEAMRAIARSLRDA